MKFILTLLPFILFSIGSNDKDTLLRYLTSNELVKLENSVFYFSLPFDLHSLDCGAPDCYVTNVSFQIAQQKPFQFPKNLLVSIKDEGCVDDLLNTNVEFILKEQSEKGVNYYSFELNSNLILTSNDGIYYYPHNENTTITINGLLKKYEDFSFEEEEAIVPFQISRLVRNN